jgi:hypothetical protein
MSGRSGYQDLAPFTAFLEDRQKLSDRLKDGAYNFMGPAVGALGGIATGLRAAYEGDYVKAINDGLPAVARNIGKAYRLSQYGYETSGANNQIPIPYSSYDVAMQAAGFNSAAKAEQGEKQFQFNTNQKIMEDRHKLIMNEIYRAADHNDQEGLQRALQRAITFAVNNPQFASFNVQQGLKERAQERALGAQPGMGGVLVNKHAVPYYHQFAGGYPAMGGVGQ